MQVQEATPSLGKRISRILGELNPLTWSLGATLIAGDAMRRSVRGAPTAYANAKKRIPTQASLKAVMEWLATAQDSKRGGGIPAYYAVYGGFGPEYPETTGYIVPTFLEYARLTGDENYIVRARRAIEWLVRLQRSDGAFPGGFARRGDGSSVFNTGQIIFGLVAAAGELDSKYLENAVAAGKWLASVQSPDGVWRSHTYLGQPHVYYTMVAWSLGQLHRATGDVTIRETATRNLLSAVRAQKENGFFDGFNLRDHPTFLHFIAYTLQGLVEGGDALGVPEAIDAAARAAETLLRRFEVKKELPGAMTPEWKSDATYACPTGEAQMSHVWIRLAEITGDLRFLNGALKINELLKSRIALSGPAAIRGAVKGSDPLWGSYLTLRYPNWAAKFAADAFMLELAAVAALESKTEECASPS
jgi:hypothetical protein